MPGRLVLASASPRRSSLLTQAGVEFEVLPINVPEDLGEFEDPIDACGQLARRKALARAATLTGEALVIGADTVVAIEEPGGTGGATSWRLLGKPRDENHAAEMLASLSGTRHLVVTGVCVASAPGHAATVEVERTWVHMRTITDEEVAAYVASGEWRGKAGGYAIQETADRFVEALEEGGFDNVVGLPVERTLALLRAAGWAPGLPADPANPVDRAD